MTARTIEQIRRELAQAQDAGHHDRARVLLEELRELGCDVVDDTIPEPRHT